MYKCIYQEIKHIVWDSFDGNLFTFSKAVLSLWLTEARVGRMKRKHDVRLARKYTLIWMDGIKRKEMARSLVIISQSILGSVTRSWGSFLTVS